MWSLELVFIPFKENEIVLFESVLIRDIALSVIALYYKLHIEQPSCCGKTNKFEAGKVMMPA